MWVYTMCVHGVDPHLDFSNLPEITELYEDVTGMHVYERSPYTGKLVFAAFSGSHQDAIAKGMKWREDKQLKDWTVPYLPLDPHDVGREYEGDVIRINSQSGKGGIGYILERSYGFNLPAKMRENLGYAVKNVSDHLHKELTPEEILGIFNNQYVNIKTAIKLDECHFVQEGNGVISTELTIKRNDVQKIYHGSGNGRLDAVANAIKKHFNVDFKLTTYEEHALERGSNSQACAYVGVEDNNGITTWGCGIKNDIIDASVCALLSAVNKLLDAEHIH